MKENELLTERAELLRRLKEIDSALELLHAEEAREISTRRNLRNSPFLWTGPIPEGFEGVSVFEDKMLTKFAKPTSHEGWVSAASAAWLMTKGLSEFIVT